MDSDKGHNEQLFERIEALLQRILLRLDTITLYVSADSDSVGIPIEEGLLLQEISRHHHHQHNLDNSEDETDESATASSV